MMLAILILTGVLVVLGSITICLLLRGETQANKARTPVLKYLNFMPLRFPGFRFHLKNYGPTLAKELEFRYEIYDFITHEGEFTIPDGSFSIRGKEETLAQREEILVFFDYNLEEPLPEHYQGILKVIIDFESEFLEPEPFEFHVAIDKGSLSLI